MTLPAEARSLTATQVRILAAVVNGSHTVRDCAIEADVAISTAWHALKRLRRLGLVSWTDGQSGTLRPCVDMRPVP